MSTDNHVDHDHSIGYGTYVLVWLILMALTSLTVAVAGINLGGYILIVALLVAAVKSALVIQIFMHIKFEDPIFRVFLVITGLILVVVFALTSFDIFYR